MTPHGQVDCEKESRGDAKVSCKETVWAQIEARLKNDQHILPVSSLLKLKKMVVNNPIVPQISADVWEQVRKLMAPHECCGHGFIHSRRVFYLATEALKVSRKASMFEMECVLLAALLHDCDDPKVFSTSNFQNARDILRTCNKKAYEEIVIDLISRVSCSKNLDEEIKDPLFRIPRDADRLDATGKIGIVRAYLFTLGNKRPVLCDTTPRPKTQDELDALVTKDAFENYKRKKGKSMTMVDHYFDKLLYVAQNYKTGNAYLDHGAQDRYKDMTDFILEIGQTGKIPEVDLTQG